MGTAVEEGIVMSRCVSDRSVLERQQRTVRDRNVEDRMERIGLAVVDCTGQDGKGEERPVRDRQQRRGPDCTVAECSVEGGNGKAVGDRRGEEGIV